MASAPDADAVPAWEIAGTYLEACNCDAICPCRTIDGRRGGRSTHGECLGALSWWIESGQAGEVELSGLGVVLITRYDDDEPRSPWSFVVYVDGRGDQAQRDALAQIFLGRLGGTPQEQFPWVWKPSDLLDVRAAEIQLDHTPGRGWFRASDEVTVRVREPFADQGDVTCVIPGHHRRGTELVTDLIRVDAGPLAFEFEGVCGYEATFAYSSPTT
jgi:Protein of unknown function (DUF1326)